MSGWRCTRDYRWSRKVLLYWLGYPLFNECWVRSILELSASAPDQDLTCIQYRQDAKALDDFMVQFQSLIARILVFPGKSHRICTARCKIDDIRLVPTVAAINGHCYAGTYIISIV